VVCFGSAISLRGLRGIARLGLHRDRKKKGEQNNDLWVGMWATKNEAK